MILMDAVEIVESAKNPSAIRFEPGLYQSRPMWAIDDEPTVSTINRCDRETAIVICCTSFGAWQMLGCNIYASGWKQPIAEFWASYAAQQSLAEQFIRQCGAEPLADMARLSDPVLLDFVRRWNGPGAPEQYLAALKRAAATGTSGT